MKRGALLVILLNLGFSGISQKWALPSSKWLVVHGWVYTAGNYVVTVEKDTIVNGIVCKKFSGGTVTYESNDTVYLKYGSQFYPTYYFNANEGDTISFVDIYGCSGNTLVYAVVRKIDSVDAGNKYLKRFNAVIVSDSFPFYDSTYVYTEFIGGNNIFPEYECRDIIDAPWQYTCNYGDSTIENFYVFPNWNWCLSVGLNEMDAKESVTIYPNPSVDAQVTVHSSMVNALMDVYDANGRLVFSSKLMAQSSQLDMPLSKGVYFIRIHSERASVVKRWVKL